METKSKYQHFTFKEIMEQSKKLRNNLNPNKSDSEIEYFTEAILSAKKPIYLTGCGTSFHAAKILEYLLENLTGIESKALVSSEFQWNSIIHPRSLLIAYSQSGRTTDVLNAVSHAKRNGAKILGIANSNNSPLNEASDYSIDINVNEEKGIAATKSYTGQLLFSYRIALSIAKKKEKEVDDLEKELFQIPEKIDETLKNNKKIKDVADYIKDYNDAFYLGNGINYPTAMEGALKLKELSKLHVESFPVGEFRHGPKTLVDKGTPIIWIGPSCDINLTKKGIEEAKKSGAYSVGIFDRDCNFPDMTEVINFPSVNYFLTPFVNTPTLQLLAYYTTLAKGLNPDTPTNLTKVVS
jgi:glucosamine--fructose-6-phosphate aminotransferase (isomerizing)